MMIQSFIFSILSFLDFLVCGCLEFLAFVIYGLVPGSWFSVIFVSLSMELLLSACLDFLDSASY